MMFRSKRSDAMAINLWYQRGCVAIKEARRNPFRNCQEFVRSRTGCRTFLNVAESVALN